MNKVFAGALLIALIVILGTGFILMASVYGLFVSYTEPGRTMQVLENLGSLGYHRIHNLSEFRLFIFRGLLIWFPAFVGAAGILWRKNWGRRWLIIATLIAGGYTLVHHVYLEEVLLNPTQIASYLWYALILVYFSRQKVKEQFTSFR